MRVRCGGAGGGGAAGARVCCSLGRAALSRPSKGSSGSARARSGASRSLYLHWPYCAAICHYCDFNKFKAPRQGSAVVEQLEHAMVQATREQFWGQPAVQSVFWGGGTPSLARPAFIDSVHKQLSLTASTEITLEANPSSALSSPKLLAELKQAGINRLSVSAVRAFVCMCCVLCTV